MDKIGTEIESIRNAYYEAIKHLKSENDILEALPLPISMNFFEIINGLIKELESEKRDTEYIITTETDAEALEGAKEELRLIEFKINVCKSRLVEAESTLKNEEEISNSIINGETKQLIFAMTDAGRDYISQDLKSIPEEYYSSIIDLLQRIRGGIEEDNNVQAKQLSNNSTLSGLHETKAWKIRVVYRHLTTDTSFIIFASTKKSTRDTEFNDRVAIRKKNTNDQYQRLLIDLKDPKKKAKILQEHAKIEEKILAFLNQRRRGAK